MNPVRIALTALVLSIGSAGWLAMAQSPVVVAAIVPVPDMPPVPDPANLYSETVADRLSPAVEDALPRIYVPNRRSNTVSVIDPATLQVVDTFKVGRNPQHVVPSWDLRTLWVANNAEGRTDGSLTPIDPRTGKPGKSVLVDDPYNVYWSPDGKNAIIVAEELKRLDFRNPRTMKLEYSIPTPKCDGINHADFSIDGTFALFTCEFDGSVTKIDLVNRRVIDTLVLSPYFARLDIMTQLAVFSKKPVTVLDLPELGGAIYTMRGMPQDVRVSPDGKTFFVADMMADGVHVVDGASFKQTGFINTGVGAHGLYPSRNGKLLYVANRGSNKVWDKRNGKGSVSVIDFATQKVVQAWRIPGGGSPDMGNVSADGKYLWLSGRFDDVVYRIDTGSGASTRSRSTASRMGLPCGPSPAATRWGTPGTFARS